MAKAKTRITNWSMLYIYVSSMFGDWTRTISYFHFSSVAQSRPTLCDSMDCSVPAFPVHHQLPELAQTHVHGVGAAIQTSLYPIIPFSSCLNLSQHQGLFQWVSSLYQVPKVFHLGHWKSYWIFSCLITSGLVCDLEVRVFVSYY